MSKTRITVLVALALVILGFVATLQIDTESSLGKTLYGNSFVPALLFFIFFGAFAGILKIFVDAFLPKRQSSVESKRWERTRAKGKMGFVLNALLLSGIPLVIVMAVQFADSDWSAYVLRNYIVLVVVLLGGIAAIASAIWSYQESLYLKAQHGKEISSDDTTSPKT